ncbi:alpha-L-fucosidase [Maribellus sediminis]|uniref:alpha-L-fucosidase n=1 Tax=Maribellus sediminis TaxID=2696285 RepID=UPI0014319233|nr:alpha-L-fucosidase [Maribellus sediminis]
MQQLKLNISWTSLLLACMLCINYSFAQEDDAIAKDWQKMNASKDQDYVDYNDAKFGMFIHWGAYSDLGGVWKGKKVPKLGEWIMYHGQIPRDEYREVCRNFNPVGFNAEDWVKLAKDAGMKYIVAMTKHHDGFSLYNSDVTDFNIYDYTSFKRDPIAEIYEACKKYDIRLGLYYSHSIDWMDGGDAGYAQEKKLNPDHDDHYGANLWDPSPFSYEEYFETKAKPQMREILTKFPDLIEVWYDFPRFINRQQSYEFYKLAYDIQPNCLICSRVGNYLGDFLTAGDNQIPTTITTEYRTWETPGTLNNTWGYKCYDNDWKSFEEVLYWIVEIASKGGNYLLNIGPDGKGYVPEESVKLLKQVGKWMAINGEAIYGTSRWETFREGPTRMEMKSTTDREEHGFDLEFTPQDFWFTKKGNVVYAISLSSELKDKLTIKSLSAVAPNIERIDILGNQQNLKWEAKNNIVDIWLNQADNTSEAFKNGLVLKVTFKE